MTVSLNLSFFCYDLTLSLSLFSLFSHTPLSLPVCLCLSLCPSLSVLSYYVCLSVFLSLSLSLLSLYSSPYPSLSSVSLSLPLSLSLSLSLSLCLPFSLCLRADSLYSLYLSHPGHIWLIILCEVLSVITPWGLTKSNCFNLHKTRMTWSSAQSICSFLSPKEKYFKSNWFPFVLQNIKLKFAEAFYTESH